MTWLRIPIQLRTWIGSARLVLVAMPVILSGTTSALAQRSDAQVPWECSNYSAEAQTRCMQALIESQREQIGKLQGELNAQQGAMGQLKDQVDRQAAASTDMQRQLSQSPAIVPTSPPLYAYPPAGVGVYPGIGLYIGRPWGWGYGLGYSYGPYFRFGYRPYWGHRPGYFRGCRGPWRGCW